MGKRHIHGIHIFESDLAAQVEEAYHSFDTFTEKWNYDTGIADKRHRKKFKNLTIS